MRRPGLRAGVFVAATAAVALRGTCAVAQDPPKRAYDFRRLDSLLAASLPSTTPGGGGFAVLLMQDGQVIYRKRFGPFDVGRVVPVASAAKWTSGAVIMSLVADGKLSLDDRIGRFFPEMTGRKAEITVRQLFSHTAGITGGNPCIASNDETLATCARAILNLPLISEPGAEFSYGGGSMQVGGRIAEIAGGEPFAALFRKRIAQPLGLKHTDYSAFGTAGNPLIAAGLVSSAPEYTRFLQMIVAGGMYEGKRVLSAAAIEEMLSDQTRDARLALSPLAGYPSVATSRYGVGIWREVNDPATGRSIEASSPGAFGFIPWIDRDRGIVGVLTMRGNIGNAMPTYLAMKAIIRETIPTRAAPPRPPNRSPRGG